jgi:hypothetical protein
MTQTQSVPELLKALRALTGTARFEYARKTFDTLLVIPFTDYTGWRKSDFLGLLVDQSTLETCFDEEGYASFVIEVTTRLLRHYKGTTGWSRIGGAIERCLAAIRSSPRESERFVEFCEAFARAIEGYILTADETYMTTHVILPLGNLSRGRMGPGICAVIKRVATTFCAMDQTGFALIELIGQSTGTAPIEMFEDFLGEIRCQDEDLFRRILGAQMMYVPVINVGSQLEMMSKLELATRSRVRNK